MRFKCYILTLFLSCRLLAQLPETDIYLAGIEIKNNLVKIEKAVNITVRKGYDNQPSFSPDGKTMFFSASDSTGKIHICKYDMKAKEVKKHTRTQTSEYSPMMSPNGQYISSVVVEEDSVQRVWGFDPKKPEIKHCLTENTDSIGYYAWVGKDSMMYYKLTDPHSLRILDLRTGEDNWLCNHPARAFGRINNITLFYVIREEKENLLFFYDTHLKKATRYATDKPENQDYAWQPELGMVKSEGSKLYHYSPQTKVWAEVCDFAAFGIKKITRFSFSADKKHLAVVSTIE